MLSQAEPQESQCGFGKRKILTANEEPQGHQAWKHRRLGHENNESQLTALPQISSKHIPYTALSSSSVDYNRHLVTRDGYSSATSARGSNPSSDFSSVGGQALENPRDIDTALECCYGMVRTEMLLK
jgi:hypothetical protein